MNCLSSCVASKSLGAIRVPRVAEPRKQVAMGLRNRLGWEHALGESGHG